MCRRVLTRQYTPCRTCGDQVQSAERMVLDCDYVPPTPEGAKAVAAAEAVINSRDNKPVTAGAAAAAADPDPNPNPNPQEAPNNNNPSPPPFCLPPLSCPVAGPLEKWPLGPPQRTIHPDPAMRTSNCCSPCQRLLAAWHKQGLLCAAFDARRGFFTFDIATLEQRDQIRSTFMVERGLLSFHYLLTGCMARQLGANTNRFFNPGWERDDGASATPIVPATIGNAAAAAPDGNSGSSSSTTTSLPAISTYADVDGVYCQMLRLRLDGVLREFARLGRLEQARGTTGMPAGGGPF